MKMKWLVTGAVALAFMGAVGIGIQQANAGEKLAIGAAMPDFELPGSDGETHKLSDMKGKVVVLQFCSQECPWSRGADPDISALAKSYDGKDVVLFGVDSHDGHTMDQIKEYNADRGLSFVTLKDENNIYADAVNAKQTPEFFIVDKEGKLAYHGAFDDRSQAPKAGDINYVGKAIDSLLAGQKVEESEVRAWGCGIKRAPRTGS